MPERKPRSTRDDPTTRTETSARPRRMRPTTSTGAMADPAAKSPRDHTKRGEDQDSSVKIRTLPDQLTTWGAATAHSQAPAAGAGGIRRSHKGALLPLPEPLCALVRAAMVDPGLPALDIPNWGRLRNSDHHVLACAANYAIHCEPEKQLRDLWAIHAVWHASL